MQQEKYDVVVVGSSIGGLLVGALLAHSGYRTLVVETLSRVGGRCSTEEHEGFKLTTGAGTIHYHGTEIEEIFNEVGADFELIHVPRLFYRIAGKDYEMPAKGALGMWLDIVNKLEEDRVKLTGGLVKAVAKEKILAAWKRGAMEPDKERRTFKEWLLQYTDNELTHSVFDVIASMWGGHIQELPASAMFKFMVGTKGYREVVVPPRGHIVNMENLAKVVRANGDVWLNCRAKRILVTGKEAKGVVVQKDAAEVEIASQVVISNVGPKATVKLAGEENYDEEYLRTMRLMVRPVSCFTCFIASDRPLWPEDGSPAILQVAGARRLNALIPYSSISPHYAPPGQCLTYVFAVPQSMFLHMDEEVEKQQLLLDIREHFPLFEKHGRVLKWVFRNCDDELPYLRCIAGEGMPSCETPVRNLYCVGDAMAHGLGGTPAASVSAERLAGIIKKRYKPGQV